MNLRTATSSDAEFLWRMLTYAASMEPGGAESIAEAKVNADLAFYLDGFGSAPGDLGVIAADGALDCGAAWLRLLEGPPRRSKVATQTEPELAIGVEPHARGRGIGARLIAEIVRRARGRYPAIVLSVRAENPSVHLYERSGFVVAGDLENRVGGRSLSMRLALT